jgi:hypothetical protein
MTIRNRELSQFGSFIFIDDTSRGVGIATEETPYVGIGTTNPQYKLDVVGDTNISGTANIGIVSATEYYLNGNLLVDVELSSWIISGSDIYRQNGNVGIGSTIPIEKLDVLGNIKSTGTTSASSFISTVTTGTSPFTVSSTTLVSNLNSSFLQGKTAPDGDIVGTTDSQTLTSKTINLTSNTLTGTTAQFNTALSDNNFATISGTETLTNKTLTSPIISSIENSGTKTIPTGIGTFIITGSTGTISSGMILDGTIVNSDISASASIAISKLAASTISGISLGSNLNDLTAGSFITYNSGTTYNGSSAITIGVAGTTANTANTLVARNASGDFSAGTINCANLTATFNVTAADINSTSDVNLKTNIQTVENALDTINSLRGVSFDWKETGKSSYGVIAQELEEVLPELVRTEGNKSVNYNGIIGVLIEAVKELSSEIEELKQKLNK